MSELDLPKALAAAREAAEAAGVVLRHYWRKGVAVELKSDDTPVTVADREAELAIREILHKALPQASIYGEEFGRDDSNHDLMWLVDPLDGTKSFVRRTPFFSTQIALMHRGELVLGVSSAPSMAKPCGRARTAAAGSTASAFALPRLPRWRRHRFPRATSRR